MIHSTAVIHPRAIVPASVAVGPYCVIDEHVVLGTDCVLGPHVCLTGHTTIGSKNHFHAGCVIGDAPQDLKYQDAPTCLRIGDHNVFREHATVHRSNQIGEDTVLGSHNFLMAGAHVGHNSHVGDRAILANGALLGGHVTVDDRAFISGNCLVHQFVRVGTLALMQGGAAISKDLPPFCVARGDNGICGLNSIGLRRAGIPSQERLELRRLYHLLFRSQRPLRQAVDEARQEFASEPARCLLDFVAATRRGICADTGAPPAGPETEADTEPDP